MHGVVTTSVFEADAKTAGLGEGEVTAIVEWLAAHPLAGDIMPGTGGARKVALRGQAKAKAAATGRSTIMRAKYAAFLAGSRRQGRARKSFKSERNALARELATLAEDYKAGMSAGIARKRW